MSKPITNKEVHINFQLKNIEVLDVNLSFPGVMIQENKTFHYNINLQHRINQENNLIFVDTAIEILHQDKKTILGSIKASCIFFTDNLLDYKSQNNAQLFDLPEAFVTALNSISISTTRGIMFSYFRGTFLHNAVLPVIDPKSIISENKQL